MSKYVCILGKSGSGKTTLVSGLLENTTLNLKPKVLYTTRAMRPGEVDGVDYWFTDDVGWLDLRNSGRILEEREFLTMNGTVRYATCLDKDENLNNSSVYVFL